MSKYTTLHGDIEQIKIHSIVFFGDWGEYASIPISCIEGGDLLDVGPDQDINVQTWICEKNGWE